MTYQTGVTLKVDVEGIATRDGLALGGASGSIVGLQGSVTHVGVGRVGSLEVGEALNETRRRGLGGGSRGEVGVGKEGIGGIGIRNGAVSNRLNGTVTVALVKGDSVLHVASHLGIGDNGAGSDLSGGAGSGGGTVVGDSGRAGTDRDRGGLGNGNSIDLVEVNGLSRSEGGKGQSEDGGLHFEELCWGSGRSLKS